MRRAAVPSIVTILAALAIAACGGSHHNAAAEARCGLNPSSDPGTLPTAPGYGLFAPGRVLTALSVDAEMQLYPLPGGRMAFNDVSGQRIGVVATDGRVVWADAVANGDGTVLPTVSGNLAEIDQKGRLAFVGGRTGAVLSCAQIDKDAALGSDGGNPPVVDGNAVMYEQTVLGQTTLRRYTASGVRTTKLSGTAPLIAATNDLAVLDATPGAEPGTSNATLQQIIWVRGGRVIGTHTFRHAVGDAPAQHGQWAGEQVIGITGGGLTIVRDVFQSSLPGEPESGDLAAIDLHGNTVWRSPVGSGEMRGFTDFSLGDDWNLYDLYQTGTSERLTLIDARTGHVLRVTRGNFPNLGRSVSLEEHGWIARQDFIESVLHRTPLKIPKVGPGGIDMVGTDPASTNAAMLVEYGNQAVAYDVAP